MDSCSLFLLLLTFFGGYDLYIIAIIFPLEPENFFLTSLIHVIYIFNIDIFFWGYDLYIIAIISPLEPEKNWDFMDSCSSFMLLLTFYGGYDLYIIAIISPLELEKNFGTSWIHVVIFVTIDFFWRLWSIHNSYNIPLGAGASSEGAKRRSCEFG